MLVLLLPHLDMTRLTSEMQLRRPKPYANSCAATVHKIEQNGPMVQSVVVRWVGLSRVHAIGCHLSYDKPTAIYTPYWAFIQIVGAPILGGSNAVYSTARESLRIDRLIICPFVTEPIHVRFTRWRWRLCISIGKLFGFAAIPTFQLCYHASMS